MIVPPARRTESFPKGDIEYSIPSLLKGLQAAPLMDTADIPNGAQFGKPYLYPDLSEGVGAKSLLRSPKAIAPTDGFQGTTQRIPFTSVPPDVTGAVGPTHVVQGTNREIRFMDRIGGLQYAPRKDLFWTNEDPTSDAFWPFDPLVIYDHYEDRWVIVMVDRSFTAEAAVLLAISNDSDPNNGFTIYEIEADEFDTHWADRPALGYNGKWYVVSANMHPNVTGAFGVYPKLYVFEKTPLLVAGPAAITTIRPTGIGVHLQPVVAHDNPSNLYLLNRWINSDPLNGGLGQLRLYFISGSEDSPTFTVTNRFPTTAGWNSDLPTAPQRDFPERLYTGRDRVLDAKYRNGKIWAVQTVGKSTGGNHTAIQWWEIEASSGDRLQGGLIDDFSTLGRFYYFPSIAVNKNEDLLIAFTGSSEALHPGGYYTHRLGSDPLNGIEDVGVVQAGVGPWHTFDDLNRNRLGDYTATVVDPLDDETFWTAQQYTVNDNQWSSWWMRFGGTFEVSFVSDASLRYEAGGSNTLDFVMLSDLRSTNVSVDYTVIGGTATRDVDYTLDDGTMTFEPGQKLRSVPILITDDVIDDDNETIIVQLSNPVNADLIEPTVVTMTIVDDDALPSISFAAAYSEESEGTATQEILLKLSAPSTETVVVDFDVLQDFTNGPGVDYTLDTTPITFQAGTTQRNIEVNNIDDLEDESSEAIILGIQSATNVQLGAQLQHTYVILDNEITGNAFGLPPRVRFKDAESSLPENFPVATVAVELSEASQSEITVDYAVKIGGSAQPTADYTLSASTLTFDPGDVEESISINVVNDTTGEDHETIILELSSPTGTTLGFPSVHTHIIEDDDAPPGTVVMSFGSSNTFADESITSAQVPVSLSESSDQQISVTWTTTEDSATDPEDYAGGSQQLVFAAGETEKTINIAVVDDDEAEANESFRIQLTGWTPNNIVSVNNPDHFYTISDNDFPRIIEFVEASKNRSEFQTSYDIVVTLNTPDALPVTVDYSVTSGSATAVDDFTLAAGTLTFDAGTTASTLPLTIVNDTENENDEDIVVTLSNPSSNGEIGTQGTFTYTILDNDPVVVPTIGFATASSSANEGAKGVGVSVDVTLSAQTTETVTVDAEIIGGTAIGAGIDYTGATQTLTFSPGTTSASFDFLLTDDQLDEDNETIFLALTRPTKGDLGGNITHQLDIIDNDDPPVVGFSKQTSSVLENESVSDVFVSLSAPSGRSVEVDFSLTASTATETLDYTLPSSPLTIPAGEASTQIEVTIVDDTEAEDLESMDFELSSPQNASLGATVAHTLMIFDDDIPPTISFKRTGAVLTEDAGQVGVLVYLSKFAADVATVDYTITGGTATAGNDFILSTGTLSFDESTFKAVANIASISQEIAINIVDDLIQEETESVQIALVNPSLATLGNITDFEVTILDNDVDTGTDPILTVSPDILNVGSSSGSETILVANAGGGTLDWTAEVTLGSEWLNIASSKIQGDGSIDVTIQANEGSQRQGIIEVTDAAASNSPVQITVTQESAASPFLSATPSSLNIGSSGGSETIQVTNTGGGTLDWTAAVTQSSEWLSITSSKIEGDGSIDVTIQANEGPQRQGLIEVTDAAASNNPLQILVTQESAESPFLIASPPNLSVGSSSGSETIQISNAGSGTLDWAAAVAQGAEWLSVATAKIQGDGSIDVTIQANQGPQRQGIIEITDAGASNSPVQILVTQGAMDSSFLAVSSSMLDVRSSGGSETIQVTNTGGGTIDWTAEVVDSPAWIDITLEKIAGGGIINVITQGNETDAIRNATIRITDAGAANSPVEVAVNQSAAGQGDGEDIDGDGTVNAVDVQLVINDVLGVGIGNLNGDVDGSGDVDAVDVQLVINAALGI
jgi:hypothetical protein